VARLRQSLNTARAEQAQLRERIMALEQEMQNVLAELARLLEA
jgi:hypothetical protein